jgi:hypothetical protein
MKDLRDAFALLRMGGAESESPACGLQGLRLPRGPYPGVRYLRKVYVLYQKSVYCFRLVAPTATPPCPPKPCLENPSWLPVSDPSRFDVEVQEHD